MPIQALKGSRVRGDTVLRLIAVYDSEYTPPPHFAPKRLSIFYCGWSFLCYGTSRLNKGESDILGALNPIYHAY